MYIYINILKTEDLSGITFKDTPDISSFFIIRFGQILYEYYFYQFIDISK